MSMPFMQKSLQPPQDTTNVEAVIRGVIEAEDGAIAHCNSLIDVCGEAHDYVTRLADKKGHRAMFAGFLKKYVKG
jgi:bacterioferritin